MYVLPTCWLLLYPADIPLTEAASAACKISMLSPDCAQAEEEDAVSKARL